MAKKANTSGPWGATFDFIPPKPRKRKVVKKVKAKKPKWTRAVPSKTKPVKTQGKPERERIWACRDKGFDVIEVFASCTRPQASAGMYFREAHMTFLCAYDWRGVRGRNLIKASRLPFLKPGECREVKVKT